MITEVATFTCSICAEPSHDICVYCTKDACRNHRCDRCKRCSDCCECEVPLSAIEPGVDVPAPDVVATEHLAVILEMPMPQPALPEHSPEPEFFEEPEIAALETAAEPEHEPESEGLWAPERDPNVTVIRTGLDALWAPEPAVEPKRYPAPLSPSNAKEEETEEPGTEPPEHE